MKTSPIALLLLTACATAPTYDVIKPAQYSIDDSKQHLYECRLQNRIVLPGGGYTPPRTVSGGFASGFAEGMAQHAGQSRVTYDTNMVVQCLQAKGYRFIPASGRTPLPDTEWVPRGYQLVSD